MKHKLITCIFLFVSVISTFSQDSNQQDSIEKQNRDSLVAHIIQYRNFIYNFVNHSKLQPKWIQRELEDAIKYVITPEEIVNMAYDPSITKRDFENFIGTGFKKILNVLESDIIKYNKIPKNLLDNEKYENEKKAAKNSFEVNLKKENPEWYEFYVVKNGVTENWNKDRLMLNDIMNSKPYILYRYALDDARRHYEAPYFKLHDDLVELKMNLLSYKIATINLFMSFRTKKKQIQ
jgi:hypothetical protein